MPNRAILYISVLWAVIGVLLVLGFVYVQLFIVTEDPFDPARMWSVNMLWTAAICFLTASATSAILRR